MRLESFDTDDGRIIRQRSNPEDNIEKFGSPLPTPSPSTRRKSYIPGISRDRFADVVAESMSIKSNGDIQQSPEVFNYINIFKKCNLIPGFFNTTEKKEVSAN